MSQYLFFVLAALTVLSALYVVFSRNPMYSVLSLIVCFFTIAGHYILLNAQFLAIVHIIVYAGAIMVLFLFTVMLLNLNKESEPHKSGWIKVSAVIAAGMLFLTLVASIKTADPGTYSLPQQSTIGYVQNVGLRLFTDFLLPFEVSTLLFMSAMIGAVLLAKKEK
jgi:NADH-quinone oxidoreductase subunit J